MRLKHFIAAFAVLLFGTSFLLFGDPLIGLFLHEGEAGLDLQATLGYGQQ